MIMTEKTRNPGEAQQLIEQEIRNHGPMNFYQFMSLVLYHPLYGYYNQKGPQRGRAGDYFTSPQLGSLFHDIFAEQFLLLKEELQTNQFHLIEMGSGYGEFLEGVLIALERRNALKGFHVWAIEKSMTAQEQLKARLSRFPKCHIMSSLEEMDLVGSIDGCVFSNEFFDALPFHRLRFRNGGWKEIFVTMHEGALVEDEIDLLSLDLLREINLTGLAFVEGQEIEVRPQIPSIWESINSILSRGYIFTVDYGYPRFQLYSERRPQGTWRCYYKHTLGQNPYQHMGAQDITAHIDFSQLASTGNKFGFHPALFCSQGIFLSHAGQAHIETLLKNRSGQEKKITGAIQQLLHPDAMGAAFWVLLQSKEATLPGRFQAIPNRIRRLME